MARQGWQDEETGQQYGMDTAGSQFFITLRETSSWDGQYAAFGRVVKGLDVVENIAKAEVQGGANNPNAERPRQAQRMKTVTVNLKGVAYDAPVTIPTQTTAAPTTTTDSSATTADVATTTTAPTE